ncbi:hypothetical protein HYC85_000875 [Camellia sinensis]|uniref:Uncharacterized protein n=1 Tax=Camellia sinensis TaxID=4442 RepID=A0A7J7I587_CAMSI|nr:hypothetical protein HYC85_000875 [Camellia sinensis]
MSVSGIESVLDFLRKNGFSDSESALMEDLLDKSEFRSFNFEKFIFPMLPPPPPAIRQAEDGGDDSSEELVSFCSCTTDLCSSEFTNPYGLHITTGVSSQASSDRLSQFGTACDYQDFDMQNDLYWYNEKDEDYIVPPHFGRPDSIICPSEDKFVMTLETGKQISQLGLIHMSEGFQTVDKSNYLGKPWSFNVSSLDEIIGVQVTDYHHFG